MLTCNPVLSHLLGRGKYNPTGSSRLDLFNGHLVIDTHTRISPDTAIDPDDTPSSIFRVSGPVDSSGFTASENADHVTCFQSQFSYLFNIESGYASVDILLPGLLYLQGDLFDFLCHV